LFTPPFYVDKERNNVQVELSIQYTEDYNETLKAFANTFTTLKVELMSLDSELP